MAKTQPAVSVGFSFKPRTEKQADAVRLWRSSKILILSGPAGSGKTATALALGVTDALRAKTKTRRLMLSRPLVPTDEEIGFLPGSQDEKLGPWLAPFRDVAHTTVTGEFEGDPFTALTKTLRDAGTLVEPVPVGMLRGRTVSYGCLIVDEAQNCTRGQLVCALTRVGEHGRVIICGDPTQADRIKPPPLVEIIDRVRGLDGVGVVEFEAADCVRDPLVVKLIEALC